MTQKMSLSFCTYQSGDFEVMVKDPDTGQEVMLSGHQKLLSEEFEMLDRMAPACVWTTYTTEQQG